MGKASIIDVGFASDPGAAVTAVAAGTGSSFVVRGVSSSTSIWLEDIGRKSTSTAGIVQVASPSLQNNVQGLRIACPSGVTGRTQRSGPFQTLVPQDTLTVSVTGDTAATDTAYIQTYYSDLAGADMKLAMPGDVSGSVRFLLPMEVSCTASATIGNFGLTNLVATYDVLHANTWYALAGYAVDTAVQAVCINGPETSNYNCGGPGIANFFETSNYFVERSLETGRPHMPLFNSANNGSINIAVADNAASTTTNVTLFLWELSTAPPGV